MGGEGEQDENADPQKPKPHYRWLLGVMSIDPRKTGAQWSESSSKAADIRQKIAFLRKFANKSEITIDNVRYIGAVRADIQRNLSFFDYDPLTKFIIDNFTDGKHIGSDDELLFELVWKNVELSDIVIQYYLSPIDNEHYDILVLQVEKRETVEMERLDQSVASSELQDLARTGAVAAVQGIIRGLLKLIGMG